MDSIFAKTLLFIGSIFTVLTGAGYVKINADNLIYDFKTGDHAPIYYFLNTENVGIKKVRFDVTSLSDWVFVYKEGDQATAKTSLELAQYTPLNFVLEIHPERLPDGVNIAKVLVEAVDLQDFSVLDSKEVVITVNKNLQPSSEIQVQSTPVETAVSSVIPEIISEKSPTIAPTVSQTPYVSIKTLTPLPHIPVSSLRPSPDTIMIPSQTNEMTQTPLPGQKITPAVPVPALNRFQLLINSLKSFFKKLF
jgi:hypothetical protein